VPLFRLLFAALHINKNFGREQAKTAAGAEFVSQNPNRRIYPKPISVPKTYIVSHYCNLFAA